MLPRYLRDPASDAEEQRLMKRLGTDSSGVARILGVSIPIYNDFLKGSAYAKEIVREKASHFVGDQRDYCGPYTVKKVIASGGFGKVSEVVNSKGISFASKSFKTTAQWGLPSRPKSSFYSADSILELDVLSRVHHPNILSARKVDNNPMVSKNKSGETCVILDMGKSLEKALSEGMPREKMAFDFICGLNYLHSNSIIHRDLKVENCLIHNGNLMIIDFGLVLNVEKAPVEIFGLSGTPAYIDPTAMVDTYLGVPVKWNYSSDIYSAAWILIYIFFGIRIPNIFGDMAYETMKNIDRTLNYLAFLQNEGFKLTGEQMKLTGRPNRDINFLATYSSNKSLLEKHSALIPLVVQMLSLNPEERPPTKQIIQYFQTTFRVVCPMSVMSYEASPVTYTNEYTLEYRSRILLEMTSSIELIKLPLLACTSDILDRIVATSPELSGSKLDLYLAGFVAKYLAFSVLGYGVNFNFEDIVIEVPNYEMTWKAGLEGPQFNKRIKYIIEKLNYRIFRPSIAGILNLPPDKAKQFIYSTLSPSNIILL